MEICMLVGFSEVSAPVLQEQLLLVRDNGGCEGAGLDLSDGGAGTGVALADLSEWSHLSLFSFFSPKVKRVLAPVGRGLMRAGDRALRKSR